MGCRMVVPLRRFNAVQPRGGAVMIVVRVFGVNRILVGAITGKK
jgi:hypothetical protein